MAIGAEHDQRVVSIVETARSRPANEREAYLRLVCTSDPGLYEEISEVLAWEERMGRFMQASMLSLVDLARPFQIGQVIADRFEIVREIGEGGMGVVYEAFDRTREQKIALKSAKPGFQSVLSPELEGALKVRHPNICLVNEIHRAITAHGPTDFLTMELLDGVTLAAHLAQHGNVRREAAVVIARQLCAGLAEAHGSNVIHRDLKATNVMLCRAANGSMRIVITDFGLAGAATPTLPDVGGTPAYMAPELFAGRRTSKASDIYALGVILHELVIGGQPQRRAGTALPDLRKSGDARWDRVIRRCLDPSPGRRFENPADISRALTRKLVHRDTLLAGGVVLAVLLAFVSLQPGVHTWLADRLWPGAGIRLAVLPIEGPAANSSVVSGALQDASGRVSEMRSDRRSVVVIAPRELLDNRIATAAQAGAVLHATHALRTTVRAEGEEFIMRAAVVDLATDVNIGDLSARYTNATIGNMPSALAGAVSLALRLDAGEPSGTLSPAAAVPYDRALYLLRNDDRGFTGAIPLFEEAARLDTRSTLPLAALIEAHIARYEATKDAAAIEAARRALRAADSINPDSIAGLLAAGLLAETTGEYEKARETYRRVQDLDPRNLAAYLRIASVEDELNMADRAIDAYRRAIKVAPDYYKPYQSFGVFYYYRGKYREAAQQFQKSIERAPGRFEAYTDLAAAWSDLGDNDNAEQALRKSLQIRETADAWNSLGAIRAFQKRDADAVGYYERAAAMEPAYFVYWLNLGDSARRLGAADKSEAAYGKGLALAKAELAQNPRLGLSRAYAGYFEARLGSTEIATDDIAEALKFSPGDSKVVRRAVLAYEALGRRADAFRILGASSHELLLELARHPDLVAFAGDPRFRELMDNMQPGVQ